MKSISALETKSIQVPRGSVARRESTMTDALTTYLQDHLAGAMHAIELLKAMNSRHDGGTLGQFASELLSEIEADRDLLAD